MGVQATTHVFTLSPAGQIGFAELAWYANALIAIWLWAFGANVGSFSRSVSAVSPEVNITVARRLSACLELSAGYTFIYWSRVALAGEQIDPALRVPATQFGITESGFGVHGLNVGAELRF